MARLLCSWLILQVQESSLGLEVSIHNQGNARLESVSPFRKPAICCSSTGCMT